MKPGVRRSSGSGRPDVGRLIAVALLTAVGLSPAIAQSGTPAWQKRYIAIAGAWFLERRCRSLPTAERREFEWLMAQLTLALAGREGLATVRGLQDGALKLIARPVYAGCGPNNRRAVLEAVPWARVDLRALSGQVYDRRRSYRAYALGRFTIALARTGIDRRCAHVPANERERLDKLRRAVATGLAEAYGARPVVRAIERAAAAAARDKAPCGPATEGRLRAAIQDLRELRREFAP